ncbi:MAG: glycosyltransferase family 2 protein [Bifidobacterium sp.]|jgi:glycosyltransferase involved in cell wall biosynthesis|nr:glycosyltransferase family 2 protein [Bifidobacterium sp.]
MIDISVIVPIYYGNPYIGSIFDMISENSRNLDKKNVELILINDSPDYPLKLDKSKVSGFKLVVIDNEKNSGIHFSRIRGFLAASGKYVMFFDQDDHIEPYTLSSQLSRIGDSPAILSNGYVETMNSSKTKIFPSEHYQKLTNNLNSFLFSGNQIVSPGICLMAKWAVPHIWLSEIQKVNGSDDLLLWCSFLSENKKFTFNNEYLYTHIYTGHNTSDNATQMANSVKETLSILKKNKMISDDQYLRGIRQANITVQFIGVSPIRKLLSLLFHRDWTILLYKFLCHK